jgi:hypothetical protein
MSIKSINEPDGPGRTTMLTPLSINEPPTGDDLPPASAAPVLEALDPSSCAVGDPDFTLFVHGKGLYPGSVIHFAGHDEPTTFHADTRTVSTGVKPSLWQSPVVVQCAVKNGDLMSNALDFTFGPATKDARR